MKTFDEIKEVVDSFVVSLGRRSSYSLERVQKLLDHLGNPQETFRIVHIAGTSGKSSTAYYMASMLEAAGYKTGLSISPYLEELNERVQMGIKPVSQEIFCRQFTEFFEIVKKLDIRPTYFELFVSFTYWYFAKIKVDYAVIEVGLGGLLDATNTVKRADKVCIITDIGLDHVRILGDTIGEIAAQKAGIIQSHNHVFMYEQGSEVETAVENKAREKHAIIHYSKLLPEVPTDLPEFQKRNWNLAANALRFILVRDGKEINPKAFLKTGGIVVPGRLEIIKIGGKSLILDGAHNPQKMHSLAESFKVKFPDSQPAILFAVGENKDVHLAEMAEAVKTLHGFTLITTFSKQGDDNNEHVSIAPEKVAANFNLQETAIEPDMEKALDNVLARPEEILLITGSLYLVGAVRKLLRQRNLLA